ncbi:MAG: hypothetical protein KAJ44_06185 [Thermoplasmatales archaeon]|nr:hypothetical protein [Thermoplasmatales archaeon]
MKKKFVNWSDKHKRAYRKINLGIRKRKNRGILRFLTLGSPPEFKGDIGVCFVKLKKRIKRLKVDSLVGQGYISKSEAKYVYGCKSGDKPFGFSYVRIKTSEGCNGVLHVLFFGDYIPQKWIYDNWKGILGVVELANQSVDIRMCKSKIKDTAKLSSYCVNQYVANQDGFINSSASWSWCFRGCVGQYNRLSKFYFNEINNNNFWSFWDAYVKRVCVVESQHTLDNYGLEIDGSIYINCKLYVPENPFSGKCMDCCFQNNICYVDYWRDDANKCIYGKKGIEEWKCFELFECSNKRGEIFRRGERSAPLLLVTL